MSDECRYGPPDATLNSLRMDMDGVTGEQIRAQLEHQLGLGADPG